MKQAVLTEKGIATYPAWVRFLPSDIKDLPREERAKSAYKIQDEYIAKGYMEVRDV